MGEHDAFFKRIFSNPAHAAGELASVLPPALVVALDLSKLVLIPGSFVDEAMKQRHTDLLFRAPVKGSQRRGRPKDVYLYFIYEHLSQPDPLAPFRLNQYMDRVWARLLLESPRLKVLPAIIPLIIHHGPGGWRGPRRLHDVIEGLEDFPALRPFVPNFELLIDDLSLATDDDLLGRPMAPVPKVATWLLRDGRNVDTLLTHLPVWGPELERAARVAPGEITALLRYLLAIAGRDSWREVRHAILRNAPATEASMISIADHLIDQGRQEGRSAMQNVLRSLLRTRFGGLSAELDARIDAADVSSLEEWTPRVMTASRVEDVFNPQ